MGVTVGARQSRAANGTGPGLTTAHVACRVAPVRGSGVSHGGGANACAIPFGAGLPASVNCLPFAARDSRGLTPTVTPAL